MKKASIFLLFIFFSYNISFGQLLNDPYLSVEDFEIALTNPDHLRRILIKNNFDYSTGTTGKLNGAPIINPLVPDLEATNSEFWRKKSARQNTSSVFGSGIISRIGIYDWEPGHSPKPGVIRTIIVFLNEDYIDTYEVTCFFESIKSKYSKVQISTDHGFSQRYLCDIFSNDYNSKIQVRTGKTWIEPTWISTGYNISFDFCK